MLFTKLNLPWILSRRKVFFSILIDIFLYFIFFFENIFKEEIFSLDLFLNQSIIFILWGFISYVLGRYNFASNYGIKKPYYKFFITTFSFIIFILAIKLISITFIDIYLLNNFFLKFIFYLIINLLLINLLIIFIKNKNKKDLKYIFIGNQKTLDSVDSEIIKNRFEVIKVENRQFNKKFTNNFDYLIIEKMDDLPKNIYTQLINYRKQNKSIITLFDWCEIYLERIPSLLVTKTDVIRGILNSEKNIEMRIKRLSDFVLSLILLILSFPILLISIFVIYLQDSGPIFYSQIRTGKNGDILKITKLRTMKVNAEKKGPQWSKKNDPRITQFGYLLRKLRIDELPQLISVLKGEMSLIGPRPERPIIEKELIKKIPNYHLRYSIRPGISGWAQVNYPYGASINDSAKKLSYDLFYIKNFSIFLDILIFFKTIKLVFNAKGAIAKN